MKHLDPARGRRRTDRRVSVSTTAVAAVALASVLAPGAVYAATTYVGVLRDPFVSTAQTRITADGHIGVRGDVGTYPDVPLGSWHEYTWVSHGTPTYDDGYGRQYVAMLVHTTPAGSALALGSVSAYASEGNPDKKVWLSVVPGKPDGTCDETDRGYGGTWVAHGLDAVLHLDLMTGDREHTQTFPVPLVVPAASTPLCLWLGGEYLRATADDGHGFDLLQVQAVGFDSPATPQRFTPPSSPK